jgi:Tfp pilus assembly protein PilX
VVVTRCADQQGYALVTVLLLLSLIAALLAAYFTLTTAELSTTRSSLDSVRGFYAAEAGLNIRARAVRQIFEGYAVPNGAGPTLGSTPAPCEGSNQGSGDFTCLQHDLHERSATTYLAETAGNPASIVIPRGEPYQNLKAQEFRYVITSTATSVEGRTEAVLEMRIKSRLVPLFQFIAFYGKDLELQPLPLMTLSGAMHTNGDIYFNPDFRLDIHGQVTSAGDIYRGQKSADSCDSSLLQVIDPDNLAPLPSCSGGRKLYSDSDLDPWNGMLRPSVESVYLPPPEFLDPIAGQLYWDRADIRIMLDLNGPPAIEVRNADGSVHGAATVALGTCSAVSHVTSFRDNREGSMMELLDVDVEELLDCLHANSMMGGKGIDDDTDGGLIWYLGVDGPNSGTLNNYGVRVYNGSQLASSLLGAPEVKGLTIATSQAAYVQGDYNSTNKKPAAILCDAINVLSNDWVDANSVLSLANRVPSNTTINAAFLAGTDTTGGAEGPAGQDLGDYNGGLENHPRFHEDWTGHTLSFRGSLVSLNEPRHVSGSFAYGDPIYTAPIRDWDYDTDFDDANMLPPLTPRFTYVRQALMLRRFDL